MKREDLRRDFGDNQMTLKRDSNCRLCALGAQAKFVCLLGKGPEPCDVMIIGEAPGKREDDSGKPFVGQAGEILEDMLAEIGLTREDVFITNAVSCRPPDNRTPKAKEIETCKKWLRYQMAMVKPRFVMLLGNVPLQSVLGVKGIRKMRGKAVEKDGMIILPTYHPAAALYDRNDTILPQIKSDFRRFKEIVDFGGIPYEKEINFTIVDTWRKVDQMIDALVGAISGDIETTCLYPWEKGAALNTVGFGTAVGEFIIPVHHRESPWSDKELEEIFERVSDRLEDCIVSWQFGKFDLLWLKVKLDLDWRNDFDTGLAHYMVDENSNHDLEYLSQIFFGAPKWDLDLKTKQGGPLDVLAKYHAHDLYYTRKLYFKLLRMLKEDLQVKRVFDKIMMPCANLYVEMELEGCYIDVKRMDEVEDHLIGIMEDCERKLRKWGEINWASPKQVGQLLYGKLRIKCPLKTKKGNDSTSETALNQIDHPCVSDLLKYRGAKQQWSFFIEGWRPYIVDHRIHPSFKLHGTVTGRPSCEHPNFQQVPRDKIIRTLVIAPPGWELVESDLSQIELRVVGEISGEPNLREAFNKGWDIHWLTCMREIERGAAMKDLVIDTARTAKQLRTEPRYAEAIEILLDIGPDIAAEIDEQWKELRKKAKAVNFGYTFGMWWKKFKVYARDNYGVNLTDQQAKDSRVAFFQMYGLEDWHDRQRSFARMNGYVRTLTGRKRRLPAAQERSDTPERAEALRQAINSPVQGFANELNLMVLLQIRQEFPRNVVRPVSTVHDAILTYVRKDWVRRFHDRVIEIMQGPELLEAFGIDLSVPICGEVKIGPWGAGVSIEKWEKANARPDRTVHRRQVGNHV